MFQVHRHKTERGRFFIYEQYKDEAALEFHRASPHFAQYVTGGLLQLMKDRVREMLHAVA